jgi:DNA polymerase-3 subunit delta'
MHSILIVGGTQKKRKLEVRNLMLEKRLEAGNWSGQASSVQHHIKPPASSTQLQSSVDITVLEPEEDSTSITIDQVRDLQHQLSLKPYAAKFKTGIILEAQRMTIEAQNALLKTLEEPPASSVLILTAPSTKNLLPTIVSRCQIFRLPSEIDLDLESEEYKKGVEEFLQLLQQGRGERLAWIETNKPTFQHPASSVQLLDIWASVLRDILLTNVGCPSLSLIPQISPISQISPQTLTTAVERTLQTKNLLAKTNVSPRLALEVLLLDLPVFSNPKG